MKKIALFVAAVFSMGIAQAQTSPRLGLKAGVTYSNISGKELRNEDIYDNKLGFTGGITANFNLTSDGFLSLQPELLYSQRGYQYRDREYTLGSGSNAVTYKSKGDVNFNYLDLPVLLKINAGGLFFEAGPQVSYLLGIKNNTEEKVGSQSYEKSERISKDDLSEIEIGYAAGIGYQLTNGLNLGLRYTGGINSLAKEDNDDLGNARHSAFHLTLGFLIPTR